MTARRLFITGTDTGVGKTRCAAALCHAFAARGLAVGAMKPVASGCARTPQGLRNADALALLEAMTVRARYEEVNPYAFEPAIAPHIAARRAQVPIDLARLDHAFERLALRSEVMIVEGAGGWLTPLDERAMLAELASRWNLAVVMVVGLKLGCINHALLTEEAIARRNCTLAGFIINAVDPAMQAPQDSIETLRARLRAPCLGSLPWAPAEAARDSAPHLDITALL
ncbi:MAG: dethiobiotin synthase [Steroidobacteraceae bacterium]